MTRGKREHDWDIASWIGAILINGNPFRRKGAKNVRPHDINPMSERKRRPGLSVPDLIALAKVQAAAKEGTKP